MTNKMATVSNSCLAEYKYKFSKDLLRDHVAFITGGGSGIGFTITELLMRHGCDVVIASRSLSRLEEAATKLRQATGRRCMPVQMDVRKPQDVSDAVDAALSEFRKIDILINCAAGNFLCPIASMSANAFKTVHEIDTFGTFIVSKLVFDKHMKDNGGVIVNITATLHYRGQVLQAHAGSAKAAIDALTKHMAIEWGSNGVRVVGVAPGPIDDTEGMSRLASGAKEAVIEMIPAGRLGKKVDIGHAVLFMASEVGSFVSGETLVVDGGHWLSHPNSTSMLSKM